MMKMNKILGILLAVCFLMSVTAAAVSATEPNKSAKKEGGPQWNDPKHHDGPKIKCYTKIEWKKKLVGFKYIKVGHYGHKFIKKPIFRWVPVKTRVCKIVHDDDNGPGPRR
jgi:hypothetical protein